MAFSDLPATDLQAIAERGLSSFLRAAPTWKMRPIAGFVRRNQRSGIPR